MSEKTARSEKDAQETKKSRNDYKYWPLIPRDVWILICKLLNIRDVVRLLSSCKYLSCIGRECPTIWKPLELSRLTKDTVWSGAVSRSVWIELYTNATVFCNDPREPWRHLSMTHKLVGNTLVFMKQNDFLRRWRTKSSLVPTFMDSAKPDAAVMSKVQTKRAEAALRIASIPRIEDDANFFLKLAHSFVQMCLAECILPLTGLYIQTYERNAEPFPEVRFRWQRKYPGVPIGFNLLGRGMVDVTNLSQMFRGLAVVQLEKFYILMIEVVSSNFTHLESHTRLYDIADLYTTFTEEE